MSNRRRQKAERYKSHIWFVVIFWAFVLIVASAGTSQAAQEKFDVCHMEGNGSYHLITIAEPGYETHYAHGDGLIGDPVPGGTDYVFAEDCTLQRAVDTLAIAFTDIDPTDGSFKAGIDVVIARLLDENGNGIVDVGDTVTTLYYPLDFEQMEFGMFTVTTHRIDRVVWADQDSLYVVTLLDDISTSHSFFTFSAPGVGNEGYTEYTADSFDPIVFLFDGVMGVNIDRIETQSQRGGSEPMHDIRITIDGIASDDNFIDVELYYVVPQ